MIQSGALNGLAHREMLVIAEEERARKDEELRKASGEKPAAVASMSAAAPAWKPGDKIQLSAADLAKLSSLKAAKKAKKDAAKTKKQAAAASSKKAPAKVAASKKGAEKEMKGGGGNMDLSDSDSD